MQIAVIALGKVGLPVAALIAERGHRVVGCDVDAALVKRINQGDNPLLHEPGLGERLMRVIGDGSLIATTVSADAVRDADVVIVLVPLDVDKAHQPDFRPMDLAFTDLAQNLKAGALVLLETTVPVGTCRERYLPMLVNGGRRCGEDFAFAFSPERLQSGRIERDLATYPRVVGGIDAQSTRRAAAFYADLYRVPVISLASAEAAEFCKLAESIYRDVNIALANELAQYAAQHGVDFHEVIPAANSQPQSHLHRPGLGVGGHCIPVYPYFLTHDAEQATLTIAARHINDHMHRRAADQLSEALGSLTRARVAILGLTYRPGVKETAHSPALALAAELRKRGALTLGADPLLTDNEIAAFGLTPWDAAAGDAADAVVLHTADPAFTALDLRRVSGLRAVLDCANALRLDVSVPAWVRRLTLGGPSAPVDGLPTLPDVVAP